MNECSQECISIFIIQIEWKKLTKVWVCRSHGVMTVVCEFTPPLLHHDNDTKEVVSSQPSITWYKSAIHKIGIPTVYERWIINFYNYDYSFEFWYQPVWQLLWNLPECQQLLHNLFSFQALKSVNEVHCTHPIRATVYVIQGAFLSPCHTTFLQWKLKSTAVCNTVCVASCSKRHEKEPYQLWNMDLQNACLVMCLTVIFNSHAVQYCSITRVREQTLNFLSLPTQTENWMLAQNQTQMRDLPAKQFIFKWPWVWNPFSLTGTT